MKIFPGTTLLAGLAAWTLAAASAAWIPALIPALAAALAAGVALVLADAVRLVRLPPLRAQRRLPPRAHLGRESTLELRITNTAAVERRVGVLDELPRDLVEPEPRFEDVRVPARGEASLRSVVRPRVRGDRGLGPVVLLERSPFGLLRRRTLAAEGDALRVHPDTSRFLRSESLDAQLVLAALGARPARRRGEGLEFESLRDFVPGDDPRRVDWAASARRGRPVVRLYQHEQHHTILLAVDASRLMGGRSGSRTKLDFAIDASLALAFASLAAGDRVGLVVFDRVVRGRLAPRAHRRSLGELAEVLRPVQPARVEADYAALVRDLAIHQRQRALVVVLTDFVEAAAAALAGPLAVLARRHRVLLVAIRDRLLAELDRDAGRDGAGRRPFGIERRIVLDDLLRERETALAGLQRRGVESLDLPPEAVTAGVLNRYLALRAGPAW